MRFDVVSLRRIAVAVALTIAGATQALAQGPYAATNMFGYTGSVSRYSTLSDAINKVAALGTQAVGQRDLTLYAVNNNGLFTGSAPYPSAFEFFTNTFLNPAQNNTNNGLVQIADADGKSYSSFSGVWTSAARTQFKMSVSGGNTLASCVGLNGFPPPTGDCSRLSNTLAPGASAAASATSGTFIIYQFDMLASGLVSATLNPGTGVFESLSEPGALTGTFSGVFQNTSGDAASNGFYGVSLNLNRTTSLTQPGDFDKSVFGSNTVVPEPGTYALMATGLLALGAAARRRRGRVTGV